MSTMPSLPKPGIGLPVLAFSAISLPLEVPKKTVAGDCLSPAQNSRPRVGGRAVLHFVDPDLFGGLRLQRDDAAAAGGQIHDAADDQRRDLGVPAAPAAAAPAATAASAAAFDCIAGLAAARRRRGGGRAGAPAFM